MALIDGVYTTPDVRGIAYGNGGDSDRCAASSIDGKDLLQGLAGFSQYWGGEGNDTFILSGKYTSKMGSASRDFDDQGAYITDFEGAGGWYADGNDFVAFTGYGAGSTLTLTGSGTSGTAGAMLYYYAITDGVSGEVTNIIINSLNGNALGAGDYNFY